MTAQDAQSARTALGLSKYSVAKQLGCSWQTLHYFERGERKLSAEKLAKLTLILSTDTNTKP